MIAKYEGPIGKKSNEVTSESDFYFSYWSDCIDNMLHSQNLGTLDPEDIGYYCILNVSTDEAPEESKSEFLSSIIKKLHVDLYFEAIELAINQSENTIRTSPIGKINLEEEIFNSNKNTFYEIGKTISKILKQTKSGSSFAKNLNSYKKMKEKAKKDKVNFKYQFEDFIDKKKYLSPGTNFEISEVDEYESNFTKSVDEESSLNN